MKPGRCLIQCRIHSGCSLRQGSALTLLHGDNRDSDWHRAVPLCHPALVLRANPLRAEGRPGQLPPSPAGPAAVSAALATPGARVQRRPASLPDSWKSSISALRPPPFFYHIFFLLDNEASRDQWRSEPRYGSPGRPASIRAGGPGTWAGVGVGRQRVGD